MKDDQCGNCHFWRRRDETGGGLCKRRSPIVTVASCGIGEAPEYANYWPYTMTDDWCGEYVEGLKSCANKNIKLSLENLLFMTRTTRCLNRGEIYDIYDLLKQTPCALLRIRGLGKKCLQEIRRKLAQYELHLKGDRDALEKFKD